MELLLEKYLDAAYVEWLLDMVPFVGAGLVLGFIFAILGWVFGLVWGLVRISIR